MTLTLRMTPAPLGDARARGARSRDGAGVTGNEGNEKGLGRS